MIAGSIAFFQCELEKRKNCSGVEVEKECLSVVDIRQDRRKLAVSHFFYFGVNFWLDLGSPPSTFSECVPAMKIDKNSRLRPNHGHIFLQFQLTTLHYCNFLQCSIFIFLFPPASHTINEESNCNAQSHSRCGGRASQLDCQTAFHPREETEVKDFRAGKAGIHLHSRNLAHSLLRYWPGGGNGEHSRGHGTNLLLYVTRFVSSARTFSYVCEP